MTAPWSERADVLVTARSFAEYESMFGLGPEDMAGTRALDVAAGASGFVARAASTGGSAVALDPLYRRDVSAIVATARSDLLRGQEHVERDAPAYRYGPFFRDPAHHGVVRREALATFVADLMVRPDRYVAGSLPNLPFRDHAVDLALCSHLLFTYDDRLDATFHVDALLELLRVAEEVRVFPTHRAQGGRSRLLQPVREQLASNGVASRIVDVDYEFQPGANQMLVLRTR